MVKIYVNPDKNGRRLRTEFQTKIIATILREQRQDIQWQPRRRMGRVTANNIPIAELVVQGKGEPTIVN